MRVILKPVGLVTILFAFALLSWLVVGLTQNLKSREEQLRMRTIPPGAKSDAVVAAAAAKPDTLANPGFEGDYKPWVPYEHKATLSGMIAPNWLDDSAWAVVTVNYSKDTEKPHGGEASQKVVISNVGSGDQRVQFAQPLNLRPGTKYRATIWMRADKNTEIDLALRQIESPYRYYGTRKNWIGKEWKEAEVTAVVGDTGATFLFLKVSKPITFWLDDATLKVEAQ